jgi:hypothetical protein
MTSVIYVMPNSFIQTEVVTQLIMLNYAFMLNMDSSRPVTLKLQS